MSNNPDHKAERNVSRDPDGALQLILSMADTTWRMFTPPAILVPAGIFADLKFHTKPWLTVLSVPLGLGLSALLIKRQLGKGE
jgi:hypothetical protein